MLFVVTGATGHIGNNTVRLLLKEGHSVRVLVRREDDPALEGLNVDIRKGRLEDLNFLLDSIEEGCTVIHSAGMIAITEKNRDEVFRTNADITCTVAEACSQRKARLVYVSSADAIARGENETIREPSCYYPDLLHGCYAKSKAAASSYILSQTASGALDACIVCPTAVIGDNDFKTSCVGQVIDDYINFRPLARVKGGYNFVSVTDVARGILLAAQKGESGESYLLSGVYMSVDELFKTLGSLCGKMRRLPRLPLWFVSLFADLGVLYYTLRGKKPVFSRYALKCLNMPCNYDCSYTCRKLGYTYMSAHDAVKEAYGYFARLRDKA
ncbi:MAG: NAD-dependent epimerase/dehydratase family protein [Firmicutes bacterium]|nr:NAD-dependent epimerase/dehydratase family protein [Bacillota bacterium]